MVDLGLLPKKARVCGMSGSTVPNGPERQARIWPVALFLKGFDRCPGFRDSLNKPETESNPEAVVSVTKGLNRVESVIYRRVTKALLVNVEILPGWCPMTPQGSE